mgnify:CR=1 FL=1
MRKENKYQPNVSLIIVLVAISIGVILAALLPGSNDHLAKVEVNQEEADSLLRADSLSSEGIPEDDDLDDEGQALDEEDNMPKDEEGDGQVYLGHYRYPNVHTIKIHGKWYDVAIGEYEWDLLNRLPKPEEKVKAVTPNGKMQVLYYDNGNVQIFIKDDEVESVVW